MRLPLRLYRFLNPAVKESVDNLPVGLCCYWPGGLVKLKNRDMEALSFAIFGESLMDGEGFWRAVTGGEGRAQWLETGQTPVARLADGTVRRFRRVAIELEGRTLYEVIASDLTAEYRRGALLAEKRERVAAMVERQRALNLEIGGMIREREILALKTRVHDDLGRALLAGRQYLDHPEAVSREELAALWERSVHILRHEGPDEWRDSYENALETAQALGLTLAVEGAPPQERGARDLVASALVACLTNALRHAGADEVTARLDETPGAYRAEIANNGAPPDREITETGGLADLRRRVEAAGGAMGVQSAPRFLLTIIIPKGASGDGLSGAAGGRPEDGSDAVGADH